MTNGEVDELVKAIAEYKEAHLAYRNSYDAIGRYFNADAALRRLLWTHGPDLIELAKTVRDSQ